MARAAVAAFVALWCLAGATGAAAANLVALVIGVGDYSEPLVKLKGSINDARAMSETLSGFGFRTLQLLDPSVDEMQTGVREFVALSHDADAAIVYYSGHGIQVNGENYFIPRDGDFGSDRAFSRVFMTVNSLIERLDGANSRFKFLVMDACRTNPFLSNPGIKVPPGLAEMHTLGDNTLISFASAPGQAAVELAATERGLYTEALVDILKGNRNIEVRALTEQARDRVIEARKQNPEITQVPWEQSSMRRPFYFARAGGEIVKVQPELPERTKEFIFPDSGRRLLNPADLSQLSPGELRIARNEIYARHGRKFVSQDLQRYFGGLSWYRPTASAVTLNDIESANVAALLAAEGSARPELTIQRPPGDFLFPDSDSHPLNEGELSRLSPVQLRIARNEIYARRGRFFQTKQLADYFGRFGWYRPYTWNPGLNPVEQANVALIQRFERQRP